MDTITLSEWLNKLEKETEESEIISEIESIRLNYGSNLTCELNEIDKEVLKDKIDPLVESFRKEIAEKEEAKLKSKKLDLINRRETEKEKIYEILEELEEYASYDRGHYKLISKIYDEKIKTETEAEFEDFYETYRSKVLNFIEELCEQRNIEVFEDRNKKTISVGDEEIKVPIIPAELIKDTQKKIFDLLKKETSVQSESKNSQEELISNDDMYKLSAFAIGGGLIGSAVSLYFPEQKWPAILGGAALGALIERIVTKLEGSASE